MDKQKPQVLDESGDKYKYGFVTEIEAETVPKGLNADIIRLISHKKGEPEWLLNWRLKAFEFWQTMTEPTWAKLQYDKIRPPMTEAFLWDFVMQLQVLLASNSRKALRLFP